MLSSTVQPQQIIIDGTLPNTGAPVIVQVVRAEHSSPCSGTVTHFKSRLAAASAGVQIFLAAASIIASSFAIHHRFDWYSSYRINYDYDYRNYPDLTHVGYGFWSVILWFLAGGFGLGASCSKGKCLIITYLVMSIIAACTLTWYLPLTWAQISEDTQEYDYRVNDIKAMKAECVFYDTPTTTYRYSREYRNFNSKTDCEINAMDQLDSLDNKWNIRLPMDVLLVLIGLAELVASVAGAALCCKASCTSCCGTSGDVNTSDGQATQVRYVVNQSNTHNAQQATSGTPLFIQAPASTQPMGQQHAVTIASAPNQDVSGPPQYSSDMPPEYTK